MSPCVARIARRSAARVLVIPLLFPVRPIPLTWLATLATLSPGRGTDLNSENSPLPWGEGARSTRAGEGSSQTSKDAGELIANGFELLARHDAARAEAAFRDAIEAQPESEPAHRGLGLALREEGKLGDALREFQVATRLDPNDADAHAALGMVAWTLSTQATSHAAGPGLPSAEYRDLAGIEFSKALALRPQDVSVRLSLAAFYLDTGRAGEALAQAQEAIRLAPRNPSAHLALGHAYFAGGEEDKAASEFESAAQLQPGDGSAYLALGQLWFFQRKYPKAEQMFRRAIQTSPDLAPAYTALAEISLHDGRAAEARSFLEKAVALDPQDADSQVQLARMLMEAGEVSRATDLLEKVVRARPGYSPAGELLGLGLLRRGDIKGATARAEALIAQSPQGPEGHRLMALALWKQRSYENSLTECALALSGDPNSAAMLALQAIALWQLERKKDAQMAFRQAAKIEPKVGTSEVFCRLLVCDAHDIGPVTEFLHKNRWITQPPEVQ